MSCPDPSSIEAFALGRTGSVLTREQMEAHLDTCRDCGEVVAELARIYANSIELSSAGNSLAYARTVAGTSTVPGARAIEVGTALGRYRVLRVIGEGGMGSVFAAHDPALDREVALKVLHADPSTPPEERRERLAKEARAMAKLAHPNVVTVFDVGVDDASGQLFVAMELVVGSTLSAWLRAEPRSEREILEAFLAAGEGLAAAHASGLVHRDVKPENILRSVDGRIRVTDFGLARVRGIALPPNPLSDVPPGGSTTRAGAILGTPAYMSPEQFLGETATATSDQFSFAVSLFEALHGRRPFAGRTLGELRESVLRGAPSLEGLPAWQREFFGRSLARVPASRFSSMRAALGVLGARRSARSWSTGWSAFAGVGAVAAALGLAYAGSQLLGDRTPSGRESAENGSDANGSDTSTQARTRSSSPEVSAIRDGFPPIEQALARFTPDLAPWISRAEDLVKRARDTGDGAVLAESLMLLGRVHRAAERPKLALQALDEATRVARGAHEDGLVHEAGILLVEVQGLELGRAAEAEPWIALAEAEQTRAPNDSRRARLSLAIGRVRLRQGRAADALAAFETAFEIVSRESGSGYFDGQSDWTRDRAELLRERADAKRALGETTAGLEDAREALELVEGDVVLRSGPESVTYMLTAAELELASGGLGRAAKLVEQGRERLAPFGRTGSLVVRVADVEALVRAAQKDESAARAAAERALAGMLREVDASADDGADADGPPKLAARDTTGGARTSGAIDFAQRVKSKVEKPEDAVAIADQNDKASALAAEGDEAGGARALEEALARAEGSSVTVGGALGAIHHNLALLALRRGDLAAARDHVSAALVSLRREVGEDHARVGEALALEARILAKLGSPDAPAKAVAAASMRAKRGLR